MSQPCFGLPKNLLTHVDCWSGDLDYHYRFFAVKALGYSERCLRRFLDRFDQLLLADTHARLLCFFDQLIAHLFLSFS